MQQWDEHQSGAAASDSTDAESQNRNKEDQQDHRSVMLSFIDGLEEEIATF